MFNNLLNTINNYLYSNLLIILLVFTGLFFSIRTRFIQIRMLKEGLKLLGEKNKDTKGISSFQALMVSTASRVGSGNIVGVATAISFGGAGSVFWMWLMAIIGSASAFIESTLAQVYKTKDKDGFRGGPAYFIATGLKKRWMGILFAIFLISCFGIGFNALQAYNVSSSFDYYCSSDEMKQVVSVTVGIVLAILTGVVIWGGTHRIGLITSVLVPIMAVLYISLGLFITIKNYDILPSIFKRIFEGAFDFKAIFGGFAGSCVMYGVKRGLFSNEAGMGSAPNASATASVSHPVKQGLVQMISVYIDTLIICTTTAIILLVFGEDKSLTGMEYVQRAIQNEIGTIGIHFITIAMLLFAFSSIIGNYIYCESNFKFITKNKKAFVIFKCFCVLVVFYGAISSFDIVWNLSDILMGFMAIINIVAILALSKVALKTLRDYEYQKKKGKDPKFNPKELEIEDTECWDE